MYIQIWYIKIPEKHHEKFNIILFIADQANSFCVQWLMLTCNIYQVNINNT